MPSSLDTLVNNLKTKNKDQFEKFNSMKQHFNDEELELICQKGVYPYEYIDDIENLKEKQLPPRKAFYSKLRLSGISKMNTSTPRTYIINSTVKAFKSTTICI